MKGLLSKAEEYSITRSSLSEKPGMVHIAAHHEQ
jgi:hypothetical protein